MPKKVIPFLYDYDDAKENIQGTSHLPDTPICFLKRLDGSVIESEQDVAPGEEFIYGYGSYAEQQGVFRDVNEMFEATLTIDGFANFNKHSIKLVDKAAHISYAMYPVEFLEVATKDEIQNGIINGTFTFVSKGASSSLKMVFEDE